MNLSLHTKFWAGFGLIAVLAIGLGIYGVLALQQTVDLLVRLYDEPLMGVNYARAASAALEDARDLMEGDLSSGPGRSRQVAALLDRIKTDIAEDLRVVRLRIHDAGVAGALDSADAALADWFRIEAAILAPPVGGLTEVPMPAVIERQSAATMVHLNDIVELVAAYGYSFRSHAQTELRAATHLLAGLAGAIVTIGALFVALLARLVIGPVRAATGIAEAVAADVVIEVGATKRRDEIGRLLNSLATMQRSLGSRQATARTLSDEKDRAAVILRQTNLQFDSALNNMTHGLLMVDSADRVTVINARFCDLYGIARDGLGPGSAYRDVVALSVAAGNHPGLTVEEIMADRDPMVTSGERVELIRTIAGGRTVAVTYAPVLEGGWISTQHDITERRRSEEQIVFLARHDSLTRLPNRVTFQERLDQASALAERGNGFALLCLDLDKFKAVNDMLGHPVGDSLLCAVADRLRNLVRDSDTVVRLGGDEFAILQAGVSEPSEANALARRIVEFVSQPYDLDGHRVVIGISVGIALAENGSVHPIQLVKNADLALYRAKQDGRGTWRFFAPAMDAEARQRRALELDLRSALSLGQLALHYQPFVNSDTRCVTGFEALLRWHHPARGLVPPNEFISIAEEIGAMASIGAWVLQQACADAATWPEHLKVAVNLSQAQFRGDALLGTVTDALRASGIAPHRLELEIKESALLRDNRATLILLGALHALGTRIAMDDFGTGHSSLSNVRSFPFDTIKIDGFFVRDLQSRAECLAIVRGITALASNLQMSTTAEGVETEEQFELLALAGCIEMQGYLFSKPVTAGEIPAVVERLSRGEDADVFEVFRG